MLTRPSRSVRLARTSRCEIAGGVVSSARAISSTVSPATRRSVSATLASGASDGWQQANISPSRSSGIVESRSGSIARRSASSSTACRSRSVAMRRRRSRSIARLRAVRMIQAPGSSGRPSRGQRSTAVAKASWTDSSARSRSPTLRARTPTARPNHSR